MSGDSHRFVARVTVADAQSFAKVALASTASFARVALLSTASQAAAAAAAYSPTRQSMLALLKSIMDSSFRPI